jgi:hypothetical protein
MTPATIITGAGPRLRTGAGPTEAVRLDRTFLRLLPVEYLGLEFEN